MVTERDQKAIDFIEQFRVVTPAQISRNVYNNITITNNRLKKLTTDKLLYRKKNTYDGGYCYAIKPIRSLGQYRHYKQRTDFYLALAESGAVIDECHVERTYGTVKPDACITYSFNGIKKTILLEVETRADRADVQKYNRFFICEWREHFAEKPKVVYLTNKDIKGAKFPYILMIESEMNISLIL